MVHSLITTGVPRSNGQVERINRILIPLLTKLSAPKSEEWYKHLDTAQRCLNSTYSRSIDTSPFKLLFGTDMRVNVCPDVLAMLDQDARAIFNEKRDELRRHAVGKIIKVQSENKRNFDKKRKLAKLYETGELVAIKRTQMKPGLKFSAKFLGPYRVVKVLRNDRYTVEKIGEHEGPRQTVTMAEFMKPWIGADDLSLSDDESI